jgi:hypothetical protein
MCFYDSYWLPFLLANEKERKSKRGDDSKQIIMIDSHFRCLYIYMIKVCNFLLFLEICPEKGKPSVEGE